MEFQDPSWHVDETFEALARAGAALCATELPEDEEPPLLHAVFDGEQAREVAGLVVAFIHGVQLKPAEPGLVRKREVPRIDLLQACRVVNQHFIGEDVQQLSIRRELEPEKIVLRLRIGRPRDGVDDRMRLQVILDEFRRSDLEPID